MSRPGRIHTLSIRMFLKNGLIMVAFTVWKRKVMVVGPRGYLITE
jgi:hypothetical protein